MPTLSEIRKYPLFSNLDDKELERLISSAMRRSFAKGAYIYRPGMPGLNMYLIESGMVRMFFANDRQEEFMMNLVAPPDCFGLPLLLDNQVRVAGAAAICDTVTLSLSREAVFDGMRRFPQFGLNVYLEMSNNLRLLAGYAHGIAILSVPGRLARLLLHVASKYPGEANEIDLPITQGDLAMLIGSSRGRTNRALAQMQARGLIRLEGHKIHILDREELVNTGKA